MMVVPVLMASCQVSLNSKIGPVRAHTAMTDTARVKATGRPVAWAVPFGQSREPAPGLRGSHAYASRLIMRGVLVADDVDFVVPYFPLGGHLLRQPASNGDLIDRGPRPSGTAGSEATDAATSGIRRSRSTRRTRNGPVARSGLVSFAG